MRNSSASLVLVLLGPASGLSLGLAPAPRAARVPTAIGRAGALPLLRMAEDGAEADSSSTVLSATSTPGEAMTTASGTKVKVRVRKKGEKAATPATPAAPQEEVDMEIKISTTEPAAAPTPAAPAPPPMPKLSESEQVARDLSHRAALPGPHTPSPHTRPPACQRVAWPLRAV